MNRALIFGIAIFFAVVGIALIGGESKTAVAGHGCNGAACDGGGCDGAVDDCCGCHGRRKLFGHRRNRRGCDGAPSCCGEAPVCAPAACAAPACPPSCAGVAPSCPPSCGGEFPQGAPAPAGNAAPPPAPMGASAKSIRTPMVSFRR